jgi:integrase
MYRYLRHATGHDDRLFFARTCQVTIQHRTPNERGLLFATRNGTPWDANLVVKRKLYPLLDSLGIERGTLLAFRHTNSTLMDRPGIPLKVRQQRLGHSARSLTLDSDTHIASEDDEWFAEHPNLS